MCSFPLLKMRQQSKNKRLRRRKVRVYELSFIFPIDMKSQRSFLIAEMTCFENALRTCCLIYPSFLFDQCLVEMIMFTWSVVSWSKVMYQNAFFFLEKIRLL